MAGNRANLARWAGRWALVAATATAIAATATAPASARMRSTKVATHLCKTVGGGRFVAIPGFPGERVDRRLLPDIRWMVRRYDIFVTDGYSRDSIHAGLGEHPIGLATDIVPNRAAAGTWREIGRLAHLAEPSQDHPIAPWRWVGWNGDPGHGRGNHLHLSWMHSDTKAGDPARVVYTRRCPGTRPKPTTSHDASSPTGGTGVEPPSTGGVSPKRFAATIAPAVPEE